MPTRFSYFLLVASLPFAALVNQGAAQENSANAQVVALRTQLAAHPYFSKVDYTIDTSHEGVIFVLERPPREDPAYYRALVNQLSPYLAELERVFHEEYVDPLGLTRRPDYPRTVMAVLATKSRYEVEYPRVTGIRIEFSRAHFDPSSRLAITYEDHFADNVNIKDRREAVLHEFVHALQFAYYKGPGPMPAPQWFNEGLAEFRSVTRSTASQLSDPDLDAHHIRMMAAFLANREYRSLIAPIRELVTIAGPGYGEVLRSAAKRLGRTESDPKFESLAMSAFYAQSCIFAYFLHNGQDGKYVEANRRYIGSVMRGETGAEVFAKAFDGFDLESVERDFFTFVGEQMRLRNWSPTSIEAVERGSSAITGADSASSEIAEPEPFDFERLAWRQEDWSMRLAHALQHAEAGRFGAAAQAVTSVAAPAADAAFVQRAISHICSLDQVRDAYLERAATTGRKLRYDIDGKTPRGTVLGSTADTFTLKIGRQEQEISRDYLTASVLLENGEQLSVFDKGRGAAAVILAFLDHAEDDEIERRLQGVLDVAILRDDLARFRELINASIDLSWGPIAAFKAPEDTEDAAAMLDMLQETVEANSESKILHARRKELEDLARYLVHASFDASDPRTLGLHGKVVPLGEEFRVEYDFSSEDQLADFPVAEGQVPTYDQLKFGTPRGDYMRIANGRLEASGKAERRFAIPIQAPFSIHWSGKPTDDSIFFLGSCAKSPQEVALTSLTGDLIVIDLPQGISGDASLDADRTMFVGQTYRYGIEHDGQRIMVKVDGVPTARAENIGSLTHGSIFFYMNGSGIVEITELSIQGRVDQASARAMISARAESVARRLFD